MPIHPGTGHPISWPLPKELGRKIVDWQLPVAEKLAQVNRTLRAELKDLVFALRRIPRWQGQSPTAVIRALVTYRETYQGALGHTVGTRFDLRVRLRRDLGAALHDHLQAADSAGDLKLRFDDARSEVGRMTDACLKQGAFEALCACMAQLEEAQRAAAAESIMSLAGKDLGLLEALAANLHHLPAQARDRLCRSMFDAIDGEASASLQEETALLMAVLRTASFETHAGQGPDQRYGWLFKRMARLPVSGRLALLDAVAPRLLQALELEPDSADSLSGLVEQLVACTVEEAERQPGRKGVALCRALQLSVCEVDAADVFVETCLDLTLQGGVEHLDLLIEGLERRNAPIWQQTLLQTLDRLKAIDSPHRVRATFMFHRALAAKCMNLDAAEALQATRVPTDDAATALEMARWLRQATVMGLRCPVRPDARFIGGLLAAARHAPRTDRLQLLEAVARAIVALHRRTSPEGQATAYGNLFEVAEAAGAHLHRDFTASQFTMEVQSDPSLVKVLQTHLLKLPGRLATDVISNATLSMKLPSHASFIRWIMDASCRPASHLALAEVVALLTRSDEDAGSILKELAELLLERSRDGRLALDRDALFALNAWVIDERDTDVAPVAFTLESHRLEQNVRLGNDVDTGQLIMLARQTSQPLPATLFMAVDQTHASGRKRGLTEQGRRFYIDLIEQLEQKNPDASATADIGAQLPWIVSATSQLASMSHVLHALLQRYFPALNDASAVPETEVDRHSKLRELAHLAAFAKRCRQFGRLSHLDYKAFKLLAQFVASKYWKRLAYHLPG
ncbi:MAG: hypothetical protein EOO22_00545 [Comamonadaceae bacterium]|nr:MAG: hypothetical protein EOO22_00545 [Comamonadaceae bacterium]